MKKIPVLLALCLGSVIWLTAQDNAISKYFEEYLEDPTFKQFKVSEASFELFEDLEGETLEEQQAIDAIANLDGVLMLVNEQSANAHTLYQEATATIEADGNYEELVSVRHANENMQILIREELDEIREFLLIAGGGERFILASLYGEIDLPHIMHFGKVLKNNSRDWFELVEDEQTKELIFKKDQLGQSAITLNSATEKFEDIQVYPNVVLDKVNIKDQANNTGSYQLEFFSLMGESIQKMDQVTLPYTLKFNDLPSGAYFLRLTNSEGIYKNFRIVKP